MQCRFDTDLLQLYIDGNLGPLEKLITEEHLKRCSSCQTVMAELRLIADAFCIPLNDPDLEQELARLATQTAEDLCKSSQAITLRKIIEQQHSIASCATKYLQLLPGSSKVTALGKKGLQAAPKVLWQASRGLVAGGFRLAKVWG